MNQPLPPLTLLNYADSNLFGRPATLRLPEMYGNGHTLVAGTSGSGKTTLIMTLLAQIAARGDRAVINDPEGEYAKRFYSKSRGDLILNPLDSRGAYWNPGDEVGSYEESITLARSFFPVEDQQSDKFFYPAAAMMLSALFAFKPLPEELHRWMADPEEIEKRVKAVGNRMVLGQKAPEQSSGVIGTLQTRADSFRFLIPSVEAAGRPVWNSKQWAAGKNGWLFLTSPPDMNAALMPLLSFWFDLSVMRIRSKQDINNPVWYVMDELASCQYLPQLVNAATMGRHANIRLILGFQHFDQLKKHYGDDAHTLLAMPDMKIYLRAGDFASGEWASKNIGEIEVERIATTTGKKPESETERSETLAKRLVFPIEIQNLPHCHGYLQYPGQLIHLEIPHLDWPEKASAFVPRNHATPLPTLADPATDSSDDQPMAFYR